MAEQNMTSQRREEHRVSTGKKLELVRAVRMQNQYNRNLCKERERLIYGTQPVRGELYASESSIALREHPVISREHEEERHTESTFFSGFRLRFFCAAVLLFLFILIDIRQIPLLEMESEDILKLLTESAGLLTDGFSGWNSIDL